MFEKLMTDKQIERRYLEAGRIFGATVNYGCVANEAKFLDLFTRWKTLEAEYARRGYRTISLGELVCYGGYGLVPKNTGEKRSENESAILYAEVLWKLRCKGLVLNADFATLMRFKAGLPEEQEIKVTVSDEDVLFCLLPKN